MSSRVGGNLATPYVGAQAAAPTVTGDAPVNLATYVYRDATNTGLAGVGLTAAGLTTYSGSNQFNGVTRTLTEQNIPFDVYVNAGSNVTFVRCKIGGRVTCDDPTASVTLIDCDTDGTGFIGSGIRSVNLTLIRVNVKGAKDGVLIASGLIQDSYIHDESIPDTSGAHCQGVLINIGSGIRIIGSSINCNVPETSASGGTTANLAMIGDFGPMSDIIIERNFFPATETGGYSVGLGYDTNKPYGNPSGLVFRHNIFGRGTNGKGGFYGTVASWTDANGNQYYDNVWQDTGQPVPTNA